jgi:hypothetical protein
MLEISVYEPVQRKDIYIEHRAGKAARLATWRKMTQPGEGLLEMVALEVNLFLRIFPPPPLFVAFTYIVCTPSTASSKITHSRQGPTTHEPVHG